MIAVQIIKNYFRLHGRKSVNVDCCMFQSDVAGTTAGGDALCRAGADRMASHTQPWTQPQPRSHYRTHAWSHSGALTQLQGPVPQLPFALLT